MIQEFTDEKAPAISKGSPWSQLGRRLSDAEWEALKLWKRDNPKLRHKCGDKGSDGLFFLVYKRDCRGGERWCSQELIDKQRAAWLRNINGMSREYRNAVSLKWLHKAKRDPVVALRMSQYHREYNKAWAKRNRARLNTRDALRFASEKQLSHPGRNDAAIKTIYVSAKEFGAQVDHVVPISCGGWHHEQNMQALPSVVNRAKHDNPFWMSDDYLDFRDVPEFLWPEQLAPIYRAIKRLIGVPIKRLSDNF